MTKITVENRKSAIHPSIHPNSYLIPCMHLMNDIGLQSPADTICFSQMHREKKIWNRQILRKFSNEQSIIIKSLPHRYDVVSDEINVYGYTVILFRYFLER